MSAITRFFAGLDALLERVEATWWGAVVTDARFPLIHDLNYARVDAGYPDLTLREIDEVLLPAVRSGGARHFHVVMFEPERCGKLLGQLDAAGHALSWDTIMRYEGPVPTDDRAHRIDEVPHGDDLWRLLDRAFREFGLSDPSVRRQVLAWNRDVLAPAGRRWFAARSGGQVTGVGSIHVLDGVGYVDDVLTMPAHRRRGIGSAVVRRLVREGVAHGADGVLLLADEPDPIRLYRSLGFSEVGRVAAALSRLEPVQSRGSSGSADESTAPPAAAPGEGSVQGEGAG
jgi:ribosomal protein S18 acetylase RimI-like enzyme